MNMCSEYAFSFGGGKVRSRIGPLRIRQIEMGLLGALSVKNAGSSLNLN